MRILLPSARTTQLNHLLPNAVIQGGRFYAFSIFLRFTGKLHHFLLKDSAELWQSQSMLLLDVDRSSCSRNVPYHRKQAGPRTAVTKLRWRHHEQMLAKIF